MIWLLMNSIIQNKILLHGFRSKLKNFWRRLEKNIAKDDKHESTVSASIELDWEGRRKLEKIYLSVAKLRNCFQIEIENKWNKTGDILEWKDIITTKQKSLKKIDQLIQLIENDLKEKSDLIYDRYIFLRRKLKTNEKLLTNLNNAWDIYQVNAHMRTPKIW